MTIILSSSFIASKQSTRLNVVRAQKRSKRTFAKHNRPCYAPTYFRENPKTTTEETHKATLGTLVEITVPAHAHGIGKHTSRSSRQTGAVTLNILTEMQKHLSKGVLRRVTIIMSSAFIASKQSPRLNLVRAQKSTSARHNRPCYAPTYFRENPKTATQATHDNTLGSLVETTVPAHAHGIGKHT